MAVLAHLRPDCGAAESGLEKDALFPRADADFLAAVASTPRPSAGGSPGLRLREAAERYAAIGWPVLPGPECDGVTTWHPFEYGSLRPGEAAVDPSSATTDRRVVGEWWSRGRRPTILAPTGRHFDVIRTSTYLGSRAIAALGVRPPLGPAALSPHGTFFLVEAATTADRETAETAGVELMPTGTLVALPPSRIRFGSVSWRVAPDDVDALGVCGEILATLAEMRADR
ncbi:hypothetical protein CU254_41395 (plasmid) [Amycolatopsis sp. AA4]|nr:hypothetical protein CU254_41395 [Amycolatopsis sp. AA4]